MTKRTLQTVAESWAFFIFGLIGFFIIALWFVDFGRDFEAFFEFLAAYTIIGFSLIAIKLINKSQAEKL